VAARLQAVVGFDRRPHGQDPLDTYRGGLNG
jgi:hypothetical protein